MTNKLSPLQKWIDQWTAVPGADDLDIEAAHRLGCLDGAMWLLEQAKWKCEQLGVNECEMTSGYMLYDCLRKLCGKQEVGSED